RVRRSNPPAVPVSSGSTMNGSSSSAPDPTRPQDRSGPACRLLTRVGPAGADRLPAAARRTGAAALAALVAGALMSCGTTGAGEDGLGGPGERDRARLALERGESQAALEGFRTVRQKDPGDFIAAARE